MRILQICAGFSLESLGGVERYTFDLSRALVRQGAQVSIAGLWQFGTPSEQAWMRRLNEAGIATHAGAQKDDRSPLRNLIDSIRQLRQQLDGGAFEVIHSQQEFGDVAALALQRAVRAKALARTVHNDPEWRNRPLRRLLMTQIAAPALFRGEAGITQRIADRLNRRPLARLLGRRARVIHNAIDLSRFSGDSIDKAAARARLGWPADAFIVGSVGRLSEQKGYRDLIETAALAQAQMPHVHFRIVGAGELRDALQSQINALGLGDVVALDGVRSDMNDVYAGMDVFASSSLWEGLPTVILEAMSAGVPVVATAVDGTTDLIRHAETGWLVQPRSPQAMAASLAMALALDATTLGRVRQSARETARRYDIETAAAEWMLAYRTLLAPAGSRDAHDVQA
jgi:glycosyltransferase involved in cell wall biosynthesis